MTRIVAGVAGGRRLVVPRGRGTRPTSDRAREGLFSTLTSLRGGLEGARVLDLYAGSGAVGLEALSRGARSAVLVERAPAALRALRANVQQLGLPGALVAARPVSAFVADPVGAPFDVAFADPPYEVDAQTLALVVAGLVRAAALAEGAVVVLERATRDGPPQWPAGVLAVSERRYGEGTLWYGRAAVRPGSQEDT